MSGDPEQEYFSDGITEDIITDLSKVSALRVIARNTAFTFKGQAVDVKEVAEEARRQLRPRRQRPQGGRPGPDHRPADRRRRRRPRLGRALRPRPTDIFAIQDEISKAIVAALQVKLLPEEKKAIETRGTSSVEAYNLYLMARQQWIDGAFGDIRREETIVRICEQALSIDPDYAQAWALMAFAQSQLRFWHGRDAHALPAAERALAIDPNLAEAVRQGPLLRRGRTPGRRRPRNRGSAEEQYVICPRLAGTVPCLPCGAHVPRAGARSSRCCTRRPSSRGS